MRALRQARARSRCRLDLKSSEGEPPLVRVRNLVKTFLLRRGQPVHALKGVSIEIAPGESVGLVGESGSGKTTLGRCVVGLETPTGGTIEIDGVSASDYGALSHDGAIADSPHHPDGLPGSVFDAQSAALGAPQSLDEALRAAGHLGEDAHARVHALLRDVGLPEEFADRRPASLSGGERQRVAIARSLAVGPKILVCDEPVSALDVSVQAQILNLFKRLQDELGLSYLFITHDLAVVRQVVDRIYVLYRGEIVEEGPTEDVMSRPQHPYTRRLIDSIPGSAR